MRVTAFLLAAALSAGPVLAQDSVPIPPEPGVGGEVDEGLSLLEEGAKLFLRGLMQEMEPALEGMAEGMEEFAGAVEPMLRDLARMMGDISNYHAPEMLPNGDIIIRRKTPLVPEGPTGDVEI
jgi:hypothetical protein